MCARARTWTQGTRLEGRLNDPPLAEQTGGWPLGRREPKGLDYQRNESLLSLRKDNRTRLRSLWNLIRVYEIDRVDLGVCLRFVQNVIRRGNIMAYRRKIIVGEIELCILIATILRLSLSYLFICAVSNGDSCGCNQEFSLFLSTKKFYCAILDHNRYSIIAFWTRAYVFHDKEWLTCFVKKKIEYLINFYFYYIIWISLIFKYYIIIYNNIYYIILNII